jgi:phospholipid/cholesterol/gamma-HCH transport system substrate-binding protein
VSDYESTQRRRDVIVGLFVIIGLAALGWMVFKFGDLPTAISRVRSFQVYVRFPTAPGVQKDTPVRFAGYQIGRVTQVMPPRVLPDNLGRRYHQTRCVLSINKRYTDIPSNVEIKLMTRGLGSSYIELEVDPNKLPAPPRDPNRPETRFLVSGMELQGSSGVTSEFFPEESQQKLDKLIEGINRFVVNANDIIGDPNNKRSIKATLANLADASHNLSVAMDEATKTMEDARKAIEEFRQLATTGNETLKSVDDKAERLVASLVSTSAEISRVMSQLRLAAEKLNAGEGTAGRLINDARLYESLTETTSQLNLLLKDLNELIDKAREKGLRSIY